MSKLLESVKNSASFILVWVITFVALYVLAKLIENKLSHNEKKAVGIKRLSLIAMFSALAGVLMSIEFPLFFAPSFYKFDFSELPVLMISFYFLKKIFSKRLYNSIVNIETTVPFNKLNGTTANSTKVFTEVIAGFTLVPICTITSSGKPNNLEKVGIR